MRWLRRSGFALVALAAILTAGHGASIAAGPPFLVASEFELLNFGHGRLTDLVVDAAGNAYVAGVVGSYNFAGIDSATITNGGIDLRFVAKFPPLGRTPAFVAVVGAPTAAPASGPSFPFEKDEAQGLALDSSGNAYVVAYDGSKNYPVSGGTYQSTTGRKYIFKVSPSGQVTRLSVALDAAIDRVGAIAIDASGAFYLTGSAHEGLQTTPGAPYPTASVGAGCIAPYATKLDAAGQVVLYATYLGNAAAPGQCGGQFATNTIAATSLYPTGFAIAIDALGNAYVAGQALSGLAATPGALDFGTKVVGVFPGNGLSIDPAVHAFVTKVNPSGTAIILTARLGGNYLDRATGIVLDTAGNIVVAGKTSSTNFPSAPGAVPAGFPAVIRDCLLWTPEVGFLAKLSPNGQQLLFSGYLPLDGGEFDDCSRRGGTYAPARVAIDGSGNIHVVGLTVASNRVIHATPDAIIPDPAGSQTAVGNQLLQMYSGDGQRLLYATTLNRWSVRGIAIDPWQNIVVAGERSLQTIAPGLLPVELSLGAGPICAAKPTALVARVAPAQSAGSVDFQVDGVSVGTIALASGSAVKTDSLPVGIRKVKATYHGSGPFDGYASPETRVAVNQSGVCP